jgi:UMF1 family MFS transporter
MTERGSTPAGISVASWVLYDLANTIFALGVVGVYLSDWLIVNGLSDSALAAVQMAAAAVVIFLAPWAGARSDVRGTRVPTLMVTTVLAVGATALLGTGPVLLTLILAWVAVIGVNTGSVVYDALLVDVSTPANRGVVSGLGVGVGYLGSFIGLAIGFVTLDVLGWSHAATFRALAAGFLIFALPAFRFIEEGPPAKDRPLPGLSEVLSRIVKAWRQATHYEGVVPFLVGRFFYTDAINTLLAGFLALFVIDELGLDRRFFTALMAVAIAAAVVGGLVTGRFVARLGALRVLRAVLLLWILAMASGVAAAVTGETQLAWVIGPLGGIALGATWTADRVVMTRISPPRHLGEFYGLYATVGRFATIAGPLAWAVVVDGLDLGRTAALGALMGFILVGWWILGRVDDREREWPPEDRVEVSETPGSPPR